MFEFLNCDSPIEEILFAQLTKRLTAVKIIRQKQIGKYRVDFLLPEANLIIECDGEQFHQDKHRDWQRDKWLYEEGYTVLRFSGKQIYQELITKDCSGNTGEYDLIDVINFYYKEGLREVIKNDE